MISQDHFMSKNKAFKYLLIIIFFQILIWTILPYIFLGALPFDTSESIAWGMQWQLGYNKMPPFTPWILAIAYDVGGVLGVYLFAQIVIAVALLAVWKLSRVYFSNPVHSLLAVALLQGDLSFTFVSPYINPNSMLVPLFAIMILVFYYALTTEKKIYWILLGVLAACNILDKYQCAIIFILIFVFMLYNSESRKKFITSGPYLSAIIAIILVIPHFYNSYLQGFPEINYALYSTISDNSWLKRIKDPLNITINQIGTLAPMLILLLAFCGSRGKKFTAEFTTSFKKQFLLFMTFGCFTITLLFAFITDSKLNNNWFVPYFPIMGIALIYIIRPKVTQKKFKIFIGLLAFVMIALPASRFIAIATNPYKLGYPDSNAYFPAQSIANKVSEEWEINNKDAKPLTYVAGDHYLAAYMTVYIKNHPVPFLDWSVQESPWVNVADLTRNGAMFVWMGKDNPHVLNSQVAANTMPERIKKCFPNVIPLGLFFFKPASFADLPASIKIGMAYLPPSNDKPICHVFKWLDY